jgi:hypothetical protein
MNHVYPYKSQRIFMYFKNTYIDNMHVNIKHINKIHNGKKDEIIMGSKNPSIARKIDANIMVLDINLNLIFIFNMVDGVIIRIFLVIPSFDSRR